MQNKYVQYWAFDSHYRFQRLRVFLQLGNLCCHYLGYVCRVSVGCGGLTCNILTDLIISEKVAV